MKHGAITSVLLVLAAGCGGGSSGDSPPPVAAPVASIVVEPADLMLARGDTGQLTAVLRDAAGNVLQGRTITWSSNDTARVVVNTAGAVTAVSAGSARITAVAGSLSAAADITVVESQGSVARVALNVVAADVEEGASLVLQATAYDADNNVVTGRGVTWTSSEPGVALVNAAGTVTGLRSGNLTVTARIDGQEASAAIRVFADYPWQLIYGKSDVGVATELHTLNINDPAAVATPLFAPGSPSSEPTPSPDGSRIAYVVYGAWDGTFWPSMIFVANADGSNPQRLTFANARNNQPAWSPDGSRIAFSSQPSNGTAEIWVVNADGSNLVNLTDDQPDANKRSPTWSPVIPGEGFRIAYALEQAGTSLLWSMRDDGGDKRQLTDNPAYWDSEPAWSPDGGTVLFIRTGDAIFGDLYRIPATGGTGSALMPANPLAFGQFGPSWSPDGRLIAFASKHADGELYQLWTVWADGSRLAQRTSDLQQHADPAWLALP